MLFGLLVATIVGAGGGVVIFNSNIHVTARQFTRLSEN